MNFYKINFIKYLKWLNLFDFGSCKISSCLIYHKVLYHCILKLKTKWFHRWAKRNNISDRILLKTIDDLSKNLGTSNLGNGLYKARAPKSGKGKSGGFRTLLVFKKDELAIFVYGFAKNEKTNLAKDELKYF